MTRHMSPRGNQFSARKINICRFSSGHQCLWSGSARFWLSRSGSAKICGSTDPDPRGKISTKNWRKKKIYSQNLNLNYWKKRDHKNFLISEGSSSFSIKISGKKDKIQKFFFFKADNNPLRLIPCYPWDLTK